MNLKDKFFKLILFVIIFLKGGVVVKKNKCDNNEDIMEVLSKPIDMPFIIKSNKVNDFINHKKDNSEKLKEILKKAEKIKENIVYKE